MPKTDSPGAPGTPGIPVVSSTFGIPEGATVQMKVGKVESYTLGGVEVFPAQPEPVDADTPAPNFFKAPFAAKPFQVSRAAYARKALTPPAPADTDTLGASRDLAIGALQIPAAQYSARSGSLKVLKTVDVAVTFQGGSHQFSDELRSPWEYPQRRLAASLINRDIVSRGLREIYRRCGEEMLVITNPATLAAANAFAIGKRGQGMRTTVVQTGAGTGQIGTTAAEIQTFIRSRLTRFLCIHPSYVTIMGDDDLVPTFPGINGIPSDLQYSMRNDADELPDVAVGRIIGNDQAAVETAVTKILGYENTAPTGNGMLGKATIAAQFQDDNVDGQENRTFIQFAETVRTGLRARGVAVDRIYDDSPTATPLKFNDGTDLPADLKKPTFAWDGDGADVSAAWNEGRFLMIHRDHGWSDGWGHPGFNTTNVQALTNGSNLPVVMSINCSSGAYDYDETSFAGESLVKANGGSVGRVRRHARLAELAQHPDRARLRRRAAADRPAHRGAGDEAAHGTGADQRQAAPRRAGATIRPGDHGRRRQHPQRALPVALLRRPVDADVGRRSACASSTSSQFAAEFVRAVATRRRRSPALLGGRHAAEGAVGQPVSLLRNGEVVGQGARPVTAP